MHSPRPSSRNKGMEVRKGMGQRGESGKGWKRIEGKGRKGILWKWGHCSQMLSSRTTPKESLISTPRSLTVLRNGKSASFIEKVKFFDSFSTCNIQHLQQLQTLVVCTLWTCRGIDNTLCICLQNIGGISSEPADKLYFSLQIAPSTF